jgi:hypothetical protein
MKKFFRRSKQIAGFAILLTLISCGTSNSDDKNKGDAKDGSSDSLSRAQLPPVVSVDLLEKAKKDGKSVFIVITGTGATDVDKASGIVSDASKKSKNSVLFSLNRDDAVNAELVKKYEIATVPLPFILVISPKGFPVAGGQPDQLTADQIVKSIPSPKQDEVLVAIGDKRPAFIVISQKALADKDGVLANCKSAFAKIQSGPAIVEIDFDDPAEKEFLSQMGITKIDGTTITVVSNAEGQITDTFNKKPTVSQLVTSANKVIKKSSCKPGSCAPGTKGCG